MRNGLLGLGLAVVLGLGVIAPATARDRPAAPHGVDVIDCGVFHGAAALCGAFQIDLTDNPPFDVEKVHLETTLLEDGTPVSSAGKFGCFNIKHVGYLPSYPSPSAQQGFAAMQCGSNTVGNGPGEFLLTNLKYSTNYCISLRSRRLSDSVVSANWTNPVCLRTRAVPSLPSKPEIRANFTTQTGGTDNAPDVVSVQYPSLDSETGETSTISCNGTTMAFDAGRDRQRPRNSSGVNCSSSNVPNWGRRLEVKICVGNYLGDTCDTKTFDLATHAEMPIKITGGTPGGASYANSLFAGNWSVKSSLGGAFVLQIVQLSGNKLFGVIDDGNAADKGTVRGTSGDDRLHTQLTLKQPGLNRTGTVNITLSSDGSTFTGDGYLLNDQPFTWQGTKAVPVSH